VSGICASRIVVLISLGRYGREFLGMKNDYESALADMDRLTRQESGVVLAGIHEHLHAKDLDGATIPKILFRTCTDILHSNTQQASASMGSHSP
jgi:hypothetical protein